MGIMVSKKDDVTDELTRRINADLREKMNASSKPVGDKEDPDYVEDSDYVRDLKKTGKYSWIWIVGNACGEANGSCQNDGGEQITHLFSV